MKQFKQHKNYKGQKSFQPKAKKQVPKSNGEDVVLEESLEQRLNRAIGKYKAISDLVIGYTPYTIKFVCQKFNGTSNKPAKISAFERAIVGIINIDGFASFASIGKILGLDTEHDIAEQRILRSAIDSMIRWKLVSGDESEYYITEQGKEFAAHGERMTTFSGDFELLYLNELHSFVYLRNCISSLEDAVQIDKEEVIKEGSSESPLSFDEIVALAEVQSSNMQCAKERFILQNAIPKARTYYKYDYTVCFLQSIRTKEIRSIVYDDLTQNVLPHLSELIDGNEELKLSLFNQMLKSASENEDISVFESADSASAQVDKEDLDNVLAAEQKLIAQEDKSNDSTAEDKDSISNPDDLSERLHKRALYDSITFEAEIHNIFQNDKPDEVWLSSPWVGDGTFMRNRLPLIKNFLNKGGKVFVSYSAPDGGLDSHKEKMVGDQSQKSLEKLSNDYPKQFFHVELPAFHKKNVIEVKNGQCVLFTGSFNVLSFSVTAKNMTHVRAEEMCLAHYQAAINQYKETKRQFAGYFIAEAISALKTMSTSSIADYQNPKLSYFRNDDSLADMFIDFDNELEEKKAQLATELLHKKYESIKMSVEDAVEKGMSSNDVKAFRVKLYNLSKEFESNGMPESDIELIHQLQEKVDNCTVMAPKAEPKTNKAAQNTAQNDGLTWLERNAKNLYNLKPDSVEELNKKVIAIYFLSLFDNAKKTGVHDLWKSELINLLNDNRWAANISFSYGNDRVQGLKKVFVTLDGYFFSFYGIKIDATTLTVFSRLRKNIDKNNFKDAFSMKSELFKYIK